MKLAASVLALAASATAFAPAPAARSATQLHETKVRSALHLQSHEDDIVEAVLQHHLKGSGGVLSSDVQFRT